LLAFSIEVSLGTVNTDPTDILWVRIFMAEAEEKWVQQSAQLAFVGIHQLEV